MSLLGQVRFPLDDSVDLQAVLGPTYGVEWGFWQAVDKSDGPFASSLTAGITYRIAR